MCRLSGQVVPCLCAVSRVSVLYIPRCLRYGMGSASHRPDGSSRPTSPSNPLNGSTSLDLRSFASSQSHKLSSSFQILPPSPLTSFLTYRQGQFFKSNFDQIIYVSLYRLLQLSPLQQTNWLLYRSLLPVFNKTIPSSITADRMEYFDVNSLLKWPTFYLYPHFCLSVKTSLLTYRGACYRFY